MRRLVELLALFSAFVTMSQAATIQVTSTVDGDGPGTLRDALRRASDGDVVELPPGAVFPMGTILDEAANFMGPTALPMIAADIVVEGRGARLERASDAPRFRAFAVAPSGHLMLRDVHFRGFAVSGGRGGLGGGGGGLGAGGAVYVQGGGLTVERCTFEGNRATGGPGGSNTFFDAGGGAGLSGDGGTGLRAGGGGGGSRGHGGTGVLQGGGGGGGTLGFSGQGGNSAGFTGGGGGSDCGGEGGDYPDVAGANGACPGGGGGGGSTITAGGAGAYGGGGGGAYDDPPGRGGFGGGGGAGGDVGADGGLGGGGGAGTLAGGRGGTDAVGFGGTGGHLTGGGGAGLGGAIFADGGAVVILDSTFTANAVTGGGAGTSSSRPEMRPSTGGSGAGAAIFSRNGALTVLGSTIAGNTSSQAGGGIFVLEDGAPTSFVLRNTILAGNGDAECLVTGNIAHEGSGNLITANYGCSGVVSVEDPGLGPLRPNRPGSTPTMAIGPLSPAFDAGDDTSCRPSDQRGVVRPQVDHCDIGAFEVSRPVARCQDVVVSAGDGCMADASVDDGSFDPAGIVVTTTQDPPGPYPLGTTQVTLTASNEHGLSSTCTAAVTVRDATPPAIVTIGPVEILENNHKYRRFSVLDLVQSVRDNCSSVSRLDAVIARATSDEPDDAPGSGDGSTRSDVAIGLGCKTVLLRQERDGGRDGRVYVSTIALADAAGNVGSAEAIVTVPLGAAQRPALNSGVALVVEGCAP